MINYLYARDATAFFLWMMALVVFIVVRDIRREKK